MKKNKQVKTNGVIVDRIVANENVTIEKAKEMYSAVFKAVEDVLFNRGKVLIPTIGTLSIEYYYKSNHKEVGTGKITSIAKARINFKPSIHLQNILSNISVPQKGKWYKDNKGKKWQFLGAKSKSATASLQKLMLQNGEKSIDINSYVFYKSFKEV